MSHDSFLHSVSRQLVSFVFSIFDIHINIYKYIIFIFIFGSWKLELFNLISITYIIPEFWITCYYLKYLWDFPKVTDETHSWKIEPWTWTQPSHFCLSFHTSQKPQSSQPCAQLCQVWSLLPRGKLFHFSTQASILASTVDWTWDLNFWVAEKIYWVTYLK